MLAAGLSTRFGRPKQLFPMGPAGERLVDYALHDAFRAGFRHFVVVARESIRSNFDAAQARLQEMGARLRVAVQRPEAEFLRIAPSRSRPWGTGSATLAGARLAEGAVCVCNADDYYGPEAFKILFRALRASRPRDAFAAGYSLGATMSERGGVSRGLLCVGSGGARPDMKRIVRVTEGLCLRAQGGAEAIRGVDVRGRTIGAQAKDPASLGLWGFGADAAPLLRRESDRFLRRLAKASPAERESREFQLPGAVDRLIARKELNCYLLRVPDAWMGVTFPGDEAQVRQRLRQLVREGVYPLRLWA